MIFYCPFDKCFQLHEKTLYIVFVWYTIIMVCINHFLHMHTHSHTLCYSGKCIKGYTTHLFLWPTPLAFWLKMISEGNAELNILTLITKIVQGQYMDSSAFSLFMYSLSLLSHQLSLPVSFQSLPPTHSQAWLVANWELTFWKTIKSAHYWERKGGQKSKR